MEISTTVLKTNMAYAIKNIFEPTEIGYSIKSLQKAWVVFALSVDSRNLFFYIDDETGTEDSVFIDSVAVWLTPGEAHEEVRRQRLRNPLWDWHALNVGDYSRQEREMLGQTTYNMGQPYLRGKYKASEAALAALYRWRSTWKQSD